MSATWSLTCEETRQKLWIGQGNAQMWIFYTGEPETMERLRLFLVATAGKSLIFESDLMERPSDYYEEFLEPVSKF